MGVIKQHQESLFSFTEKKQVHSPSVWKSELHSSPSLHFPPTLLTYSFCLVPAPCFLQISLLNLFQVYTNPNQTQLLSCKLFFFFFFLVFAALSNRHSSIYRLHSSFSSENTVLAGWPFSCSMISPCPLPKVRHFALRTWVLCISSSDLSFKLGLTNNVTFAY